MMKTMPSKRLWPNLLRGILPLALASSALWLPFLTSPTAQGSGIQFEFLPPPMEGTLSIGVYDQSGALVRVLHKEAELSDFRIALNGLVSRWDGNNDRGEPCPGGRYRIKGYRVGELKIEGVAFHGNDWIEEDENARFAAIHKISALESGQLIIEATRPGITPPGLFRLTPTDDEGWEIEATDIFPEPSTSSWTWEIREGALHLQQIKSGRKRTIPLAQNAGSRPQIALGGSLLYILEEEGQGQRLRGFELIPAPRDVEGTEAEKEPPAAVETPEEVASTTGPKEILNRLITRSNTFEEVSDQLRFPSGAPFVAEPTLRVQLMRNPLLNKKRSYITLKLEINAEGAYLATEDGLPLAQVSETPHLRWAVMGRQGKEGSVVIFESDGSAVEEYRAARLSRMMAFDAGLFTLKAKPPVVAPEPPAEESEPPSTEESAPPAEPADTPEVAPPATGAPEASASPEAPQASPIASEPALATPSISETAPTPEATR